MATHCYGMKKRLRPNKHTSNPSFRICCQNGKISSPAMAKSPAFLLELLNGGDQVLVKFRKT
jgi:hypothetical protein